MNKIIFVPVIDYLKSRKKIFLKFIFPILLGLIALAFALLFDFGEERVVLGIFSDFINVQINIVAILISFSVAIITILVSADNENIRQLKDRASSEKLYKEVNGKRLSLFQIMLSNIAYNTTIEVFYLVILIAFSLSKTIVPIVALKIILSFCVVVIVHIFTVLLESVSQMYLTFWEKKE